MIIRDGSFLAYQEGHIRRSAGQQDTFVRRPEQDDWMDEKHRAITEALEALEEALSAAVWL
jgi:hypothetical protein